MFLGVLVFGFERIAYLFLNDVMGGSSVFPSTSVLGKESFIEERKKQNCINYFLMVAVY
jgi:hypothetical protein